ncbi:FYVE and coiled-coil domain-containing protein 1 [Biomphalaria glabrata]|nr:FYVE and coiled-coil domain-containing protein 1 [Biomphalaria glabrata]
MAAAAQFPLAADNGQKVSLSMQKKTFQDILDCIVQLKSDFFESHQPITDDSVVLQRFCAKFEHLIQVGMKEKVSLLGRKKDYWDYFSECLASSKGSNDGIKYVRNLGENKTSLGKGRAFIRFCLVHQRLADTLQQCVVHEKTKDWFVPGSVFLSPKECQVLINSLYDLNSMHFDLSPRGYDLDAAWPSFANRKHGGSGSWNVPLSRRSSITSMDAISQISVSMDTAEVDRLAKDLESAQSIKSDLIGQLGVLQQEKEQVSQAAWTAQGELQALEQQLSLLRTEQTSLHERNTNLEAELVKLKLEKEHLEKSHREELSLLNERFLEEETRRVNQLRSEEDIWKKEVKEEGKRKKREIDKLMQELESKSKEIEAAHERWTRLNKALRTLFVDTKVRIDQDDLEASLVHLADHVNSLQKQLQEVKEQTCASQYVLQEEQMEKDKQLALLEGRCLEMEKSIKVSSDSEVTLRSKVVTMEIELKGEREAVAKLEAEIGSLKECLAERESQLARSQESIRETEIKLLNVEERINEVCNERDIAQFELDNLSKTHADLSKELEMKRSKSDEINDDLQRTNDQVAHLTQNLEESRSEVLSLHSEVSSLKEALTARDKELSTLSETSDRKLQEYESSLAANEKTIEEITDHLAVANLSFQEAKNEARETAAEMSSLKEELSKVKCDSEKMIQDLSELNPKCQCLELQVKELNEEIAKKEGIIEQLQSTEEQLQKDLASANLSISSLTNENTSVRNELKERNEEKERLKVEVLSLKAEMDNVIREMNAEKVRVIGLLKESEGVKHSESEKDEKIFNLLVELEKNKSDHKAALGVLENQAAHLTSRLLEKEQLASTLVSEMGVLKEELLHARKEKEELSQKKKLEIETINSTSIESEGKLRAIISQLQLELEELKRSHENEVSSFVERVKYLESQKQEREQILEQKCIDYEHKIQDLKKEALILTTSCQEATENVGRLNSELAALAEERDHLLTQTDAALEDALQIKSQLTETSEQLAVSYTQLETLTKEKSSLSASVSTLTESLSNLQLEKEELHREIEALKALLKSAEDESQDKLLQKRALEQQLQEIQTKYDHLVKEKVLLASEIESYQSQSLFSTQVLEESLVEARLALDQANNEKLEMEETCESLKKENAELSSKLEKVNVEMKEFQLKLEQEIKQADLSELNKVKQELEEERKNKEILSGEISALQFQLSAEQMLHPNHLQSHGDEVESTEELRARVLELEIILEQMEEKCETLQSSKEVDSVQVHDVKKLLLAKQEEVALLNQQLENFEGRLNEELDIREKLEEDLATLRFTYDRDIEEREKEISVLTSDNEQIKKQIIKLTKDKDSLWHKTDQLVTEQKRKVGEKWQDNGEVTQCPQCKIEFSLFTRKHHCRLCGRIYCYTCSDFWLDSPHSSKKVRVCKSCLEYENYLGSSSLSTSMFDNESDEESDTEVKTAEGESLLSGLRANQKVFVDADFGSVVDYDVPDDDKFQIVSEEEVMKSITDYNQSMNEATIPPNMTCSGLLFAEELETGEVNRQNEVWLKPGKTFAVPIDIEEERTVLHWEFTSHPKDIVFSVNYRSNQSVNIADAEAIVAPCKCDSHKQTVTGELTAKTSGIYTLIFDNTYSRLTSKKIHYKLAYKKL